MMTSSSGSGTARVVVVVAGGLLAGVLGAVGVVAPAGAAAPTVGAGLVGQASSSAVVFQRASKKDAKTSGRKGALARAKKAQRRALSRVEGLVDALDDAESAASGPANDYAAAVQDETDAKADAGANAKKVERAKYLLANQNAVYEEWAGRTKPVMDAERVAKEAYTAASGVVSGLNEQVQSIQRDINTAYNTSSSVFNEINDLQYTQVPNAQGAVNVAWADEQSAYQTKEYYRTDFETRKAQWDACRVTNGKWECKRDGTWRWVPKLDEVQALLNQWQATYNANKRTRQDAEVVLSGLTSRLATLQAEHANVVNLINGLTAAKAVKEAEIPKARAASDLARAAWEVKRDALDAMFDEWDNTMDELADAQKYLPEWEADQVELNQVVSDASAVVVQVTPAFTRTAEKVTATRQALVAARKVLKQANQRVKGLSKNR